MRRYGFVACLVGIVALGVTQRQTSAADEPVSFSKDVLPILQKNCQSCHRPGQIAPMSLLTFRETRPWARSMKSQGREPADAAVVRRSRARTRSPTIGRSHRQDIETIAKWADAGAPEGDPKDAPPPVAVAGGRLADQAGRHRPRTGVPRARAYAERRRRVDHVSDPERLHEGHVDHVARDQAERAGGHASHLLHVPGASARREVLRAELVGVAARRRRRRDQGSGAGGTAHRRAHGAGRPSRARTSAAASTATCLGERQTTIVRSARAS